MQYLWQTYMNNILSEIAIELIVLDLSGKHSQTTLCVKNRLRTQPSRVCRELASSGWQTLESGKKPVSLSMVLRESGKAVTCNSITGPPGDSRESPCSHSWQEGGPPKHLTILGSHKKDAKADPSKDSYTWNTGHFFNSNPAQKFRSGANSTHLYQIAARHIPRAGRGGDTEVSSHLNG